MNSRCGFVNFHRCALFTGHLPYHIHISNLATANPSTPQPGNVHTQVRTISRTVRRLTRRGWSAAPTPIIAVTLAWVVLTGSPSREAVSSDNAAPKSAQKPFRGVRVVMPEPTETMIFLPPMAVPSAITVAQRRVGQRGIGKVFTPEEEAAVPEAK